jgi:hypothetical protein
MIRRPRRCSWRSSVKAEITQIKFVDEYIHYTDRVVVGDIVVEILGYQDGLPSVFAFDESLHVPTRPECIASV